MMVLKMLNFVADVTCSQDTLDSARSKKSSFTRNRGMSFQEALFFTLDMRKTSLQTRLNLFFKHKGGVPISQQAFSKLRMNYDHSPFEKMVRTLVAHEYSGEYELPLWHGYHVLAVDGSYLQLPRTDALRKDFGVRGQGGTCPSAGISVLFDVLHGWVIDPAITSANMNERVQLGKHADFLCEQLPNIAQNSIILMDRGYPSLELFKTLEGHKLKYLARCKSNFLSEINTAPMGDSTALLRNGIFVRVFKFRLPSGETETLVTNLFDLPQETLPELYALRWGVEVAYFRLKEQLCVEKFSGKTANTIRQDFWASMTLLNAVAVFQKEADEVVQERRRGKKLKHEAHARTSGIIVSLRDNFIFAALCGNPEFSDMEVRRVIATMAREVSPIRPGRSFPRNFKPNLVANPNLKSTL